MTLLCACPSKFLPPEAAFADLHRYFVANIKMQVSMRQCASRGQTFKAAPKASLKASAPAPFAGLRRGNFLDLNESLTQAVSLVSVLLLMAAIAQQRCSSSLG